MGEEGTGERFCHFRQAVDVQWSRLTEEQKAPVFLQPPHHSLSTRSLFKHLHPTRCSLAAATEEREPLFYCLNCGCAFYTQTGNLSNSAVGLFLNLCTMNLYNERVPVLALVNDSCAHPGRHPVPGLFDQRLVHRQLPVSVHRLQQRLRLLLLHFILHAEVFEGLPDGERSHCNDKDPGCGARRADFSSRPV